MSFKFNPFTDKLDIIGPGGSSLGTVITLTGNSGGAINPDGAGNINVIGSGNISVAGAGTTLTISESQTQLATNYTAVNHAASPYTVLSTDYYIACDVTAGVITLLFPNAPTANRIFVVKDKVGLSAASNITITTVGGAVLFDGAASRVVNTNYASLQLLFNGTSYEVY